MIKVRVGNYVRLQNGEVIKIVGFNNQTMGEKAEIIYYTNEDGDRDATFISNVVEVMTKDKNPEYFL